MTYTIQPTHSGKFIVRNSMGNECVKLDNYAEAETWIANRVERDYQEAQERDHKFAEQEKFDSSVPNLNDLQIRWQNWRTWFYGAMIREDRSLAQHRAALDRIPEGASGEFGTSGSPSYAAHERHLTEDQIEQERARTLYQQAMSVDALIKSARRSKNQAELARLLTDDAEPIIAQMNGYFLHIARPEEYKRPANKPGTRPDTSLALGESRKNWLKKQGGIQPTVQNLIDQAMKNDTTD